MEYASCGDLHNVVLSSICVNRDKKRNIFDKEIFGLLFINYDLLWIIYIHRILFTETLNY